LGTRFGNSLWKLAFGNSLWVLISELALVTSFSNSLWELTLETCFGRDFVLYLLWQLALATYALEHSKVCTLCYFGLLQFLIFLFRIAAPTVQKIPPEVKAKPAKPAVKQLDGYVGFANLPNQVYRKAVKKGFEFTLMVVGESGLGKSTLINSMFLTDVYSAEYPGPSERLKKTVAIETNQVLFKESGVNLTLTIVDTPGIILAHKALK
jgi:hypothetical protein